MRSLRRCLWVLLVSLPVTVFAQPEAPRFIDPTGLSSNEGHATLRWVSPADAGDGQTELTYELEQSRDPRFDDAHLRHRGPDDALFVSGLRSGTTYFRVRAVEDGTAGPWSEPLDVEVDYPARGQVLWLLAIGCVVLVATVVTIVVGWARTHDSTGAVGA